MSQELINDTEAENSAWEEESHKFNWYVFLIVYTLLNSPVGFVIAIIIGAVANKEIIKIIKQKDLNDFLSAQKVLLIITLLCFAWRGFLLYDNVKLLSKVVDSEELKSVNAVSLSYTDTIRAANKAPAGSTDNALANFFYSNNKDIKKSDSLIGNVITIKDNPNEKYYFAGNGETNCKFDYQNLDNNCKLMVSNSNDNSSKIYIIGDKEVLTLDLLKKQLESGARK